MASLRNWNECALWSILRQREDRQSQECCTILDRVLPQIQTILASGGTSPKDFTLHDQGHSFRVAERMQEIIGAVASTLSPFDLSLLLLSAYLHDIGMTPEFKKVAGHHDYLLTGDRSALTDDDVVALQTWLDNEGYQIVPPIPDTTPLSDRLNLAAELTTYYCRHRHNAWSAEWIRSHLSGEPLGLYSGWVEDLILLCQSHHFGYDRLKDQPFRPRYVGEPAAVVNLRYLALVLRMADILEFDPERTPDVILRHRDIAPESRIFWWRDKSVSLRMDRGKIVVSARPTSARLHRAIDEIVDAIDTELTLCTALANEFPLGAVPGLTEPLPYNWVLPSIAHRDVEPREGTYEYIDGAFRPDTKKLLSLLSGKSLYGDPIVAVRELVQNAFDAVNQQIAYQRFGQPNPASATLARQLAMQHRVSLRLETKGQHAYLVCTDSGIGMTKAIIRDRILVSGSGPRHDVRVLERRCREAGFQLGRSGQFGIGILSYFMVATEVEIETQRAQGAGDSDSATWHFETEGIGSFGELRRSETNRTGSQVRLRLKSEISSDLEAWYSKLRAFLVDTLVYCPCEFSLSAPLPQCDPLELEPGWSPRDYASEAARSLRHRDDGGLDLPMDLLSNADREQRLAVRRETDHLEKEFRSRLRWRCEEGTLADGVAEYMIRVPYFELDGGVSLAFLLPERQDKTSLSIHRFLGGTHYLPEGQTREAWKGMAIESQARRRDRSTSFCQLNWLSDAAGTIMVDRNIFVPSAVGEAGRFEVAARRRMMVRSFIEESKDSEYDWLNRRLMGVAGGRRGSFRWLVNACDQDAGTRKDSDISWGDVRFPAISRSALGYNLPSFPIPTSGLILNGKPIHVVPWTVPAPPISEEAGAIGWNSEYMPPDRIVCLDSLHAMLVPIWLRRTQNAPSQSWLASRFPPEWHELCGAIFQWYAGEDRPAIVWNRSHPVVRLLSLPAWEWSRQAFRSTLDPIPHRDVLLSDRAKAASWVLRCISRDSSKLWGGLPERDPKLLPEIFRHMLRTRKVCTSPRLMFWVENQNRSRLRIIDPQHWTAVEGKKRVEKHLPIPSSAWRIAGADRLGPLRLPRK